MINIKGFTVFILLFVSGSSYAQYDGIDGRTESPSSQPQSKKNRNDNTDTLIDDYETRPSITDNISLYKGLEFMTNGNQNLLYLLFDPQVAANFNDRLLLGGGVHVGLNDFSGTAGVFGFSRLMINQIFFQAEYRKINILNAETGSRDWVSSPVIMVGYCYGAEMSTWTSIGFSTNGTYSRNMPFGAFVFKFGIQF
jgi:hypothetical protein